MQAIRPMATHISRSIRREAPFISCPVDRSGSMRREGSRPFHHSAVPRSCRAISGRCWCTAASAPASRPAPDRMKRAPSIRSASTISIAFTTAGSRLICAGAEMRRSTRSGRQFPIRSGPMFSSFRSTVAGTITASTDGCGAPPTTATGVPTPAVGGPGMRRAGCGSRTIRGAGRRTTMVGGTMPPILAGSGFPARAGAVRGSASRSGPPISDGRR